MVRMWRVDQDSFISTTLNLIFMLCKRMSVHLASILATQTPCALILQRDISARVKVDMRVMERPVMMPTSVRLVCTIVMITQPARTQKGHSSAIVIRISVETAKNVSPRTVYQREHNLGYKFYQFKPIKSYSMTKEYFVKNFSALKINYGRK